MSSQSLYFRQPLGPPSAAALAVARGPGHARVVADLKTIRAFGLVRVARRLPEAAPGQRARPVADLCGLDRCHVHQRLGRWILGSVLREGA